MRPLVFSDRLALVVFYAAFILWSLSELQIVVAKRGGHGGGHDRGSKERLVAFIWLGLAAAFSLSWVTATVIPGWRWAPVIVGVAMILIGIAVRRWAVSVLGRFFTTSVEILDDHRVVDAGPYRIVRHPAYAGGLLSMVGTGLALGNWLSLLAALFGGLVAFIQRIRVEELALVEGLGSAYVSFATHRKRLIPGIW